jgi:hypothetical protein
MGSGRLSSSTGQSTQMLIQVQKILSSSVQHFSTSVGSRKCHPDFFPLSVFCPCLVLGRTQSILDNESGADCYSSLFQLGPTGCCLCMFGSIANCCFPLAVSPLFGCCSMCQRARIMEQFNIEGSAGAVQGLLLSLWSLPAEPVHERCTEEKARELQSILSEESHRQPARQWMWRPYEELAPPSALSHLLIHRPAPPSHLRLFHSSDLRPKKKKQQFPPPHRN